MKLVVALLCVACGCGKKDSGPTTTTTSGSSTASGSAPTTPPSTTATISDAIRVAICKQEPCGGDMSSITVYRDASGVVKKLYRLYGRCSHNAGMYFDPDGKLTETIAEEPIEPGSERAKEIDAKHKAQVGDLKPDEKTISCRGV